MKTYFYLLSVCICIILFSFNAEKAYAQVTRSLADNTQIKAEIGSYAPEIEGTTVQGQKIKLSGYRGKIVMIQFWSSWCKPCRADNPALLEIYNEFKDKAFVNGGGFVIFSVALDDNAENWKQAIKEDNITWPAQISDLKGAYSDIAALYKVSNLPANFLIDGEGIIIAKGFRASGLKSILEAHLDQ